MMGVAASTCPTCGKAITIVYEDRSLGTLLVDRMCECPSAKAAKVATDWAPLRPQYRP